MSYPTQPAVFRAVHGTPAFKTLIVNVLMRYGQVEKRVAEELFAQNANEYSQVFTSSSIDDTDNYEIYEQLGDIACNHAIVNYAYKAFPELSKTPAGVNIVARIRIKWGSKECMCRFGERLGFWPFISASSEFRSTKKKALLEDVFEAFCGFNERLFDAKYGMGCGYSVVFSIVSKVLEASHISLAYEELWDPITRRKELVEYYFLRKSEVGLPPLINKFEKTGAGVVCNVMMYKGGRYPILPNGRADFTKSEGGRPELFVSATGSTMDDANSKASELVISKLGTQGITKAPPEIYQLFLEGNKKRTLSGEQSVETVQTKLTELGISLNDLYQFDLRMNRLHIQVSKRSILAQFAKLKNFKGVCACLSLGADPALRDTRGYTLLDFLFIDSDEENEVESRSMKKIIKKLKDAGVLLCIHAPITELYASHPALIKYGKHFVIESVEEKKE
jgi:hypothetical protein